MGTVLTKVGKRIREIRKAKGYSQFSLGEKCGFTFSYIGGIERAEKNISLLNLEKIAEALDVEIYEFFIDYKDEKQMAEKKKQISDLVELLNSLDAKDLKKAKIILDEVFKNK